MVKGNKFKPGSCPPEKAPQTSSSTAGVGRGTTLGAIFASSRPQNNIAATSSHEGGQQGANTHSPHIPAGQQGSSHSRQQQRGQAGSTQSPSPHGKGKPNAAADSHGRGVKRKRDDRGAGRLNLGQPLNDRGNPNNVAAGAAAGTPRVQRKGNNRGAGGAERGTMQNERGSQPQPQRERGNQSKPQKGRGNQSNAQNERERGNQSNPQNGRGNQPKPQNGRGNPSAATAAQGRGAKGSRDNRGAGNGGPGRRQNDGGTPDAAAAGRGPAKRENKNKGGPGKSGKRVKEPEPVMWSHQRASPKTEARKKRRKRNKKGVVGGTVPEQHIVELRGVEVNGEPAHVGREDPVLATAPSFAAVETCTAITVPANGAPWFQPCKPVMSQPKDL
jgi:hypothetical protein